VISRSKGDSVNKVEFKHPEDENFTVYSNFSTKYPEAVNTFLLNLPKDEENKALYYAKQSKKLFLIDQTSQSMPKTLSQLLNIGDLEEVGKILGSEVNAIEKSFKLKSKDYDQLKTEIDEKYADLENDLLHKTSLEQLLESCTLIEEDCNQISGYINKLQRLKDSNREISNTISECEKIVNSVSDHLDELETLEDKFKNLSSYIKIVNKYNNNKANLEAEISKAKAICDENFVQSISDIESLKNNLNDLKKFINFFLDQQTLIDDKKNEITKLSKKIDADKQEYERIKTILIDEKIVCETCNKFGGELI
jgi:chromosome segregation ATPase